VHNKLSLTFERELSVEDCPILRSHVIDGKAVLPAALLLEWLAHGALHGNPGMTFHGVDALRILKGVRLEEDEVCLIRVLAGKAVRQDHGYRVAVEMQGRDRAGQKYTHARADILLTDGLPARREARPLVLTNPVPYGRNKNEIYRRLFHGTDLQGIERIETCTAEGLSAWVTAGPRPAAWFREPLRASWLSDPYVLDGAFQLMTLWSYEVYGAFSLPCAVGCYRQYRRTFPRADVRIVANTRRTSGQRALADIEIWDGAGEPLGRLEEYECILDAALAPLFRRNQLGEVVPS
jgi:hypothetical protein